MFKNIKILDSFTLKILAMTFMLCDHLWATIIPGNQWLNNIGRLAFPIFAFQIAEGAFHTQNFNRYLKRVFLFALLSELPFNLMYNGSALFPFHQNVLFTFTLALLLIKLINIIIAKKKKTLFTYLNIIGIFILGYILGFVTFSDYYGNGILMVLLFYFGHFAKYGKIIELLGMIFLNYFSMGGMEIPFHFFGKEFFFPQQAFAIFSLIPIWLYNGKYGIKHKFIQYACYLFYPLHMLLLVLISYFIS